MEAMIYNTYETLCSAVSCFWSSEISWKPYPPDRRWSSPAWPQISLQTQLESQPKRTQQHVSFSSQTQASKHLMEDKICLCLNTWIQSWYPEPCAAHLFEFVSEDLDFFFIFVFFLGVLWGDGNSFVSSVRRNYWTKLSVIWGRGWGGCLLDFSWMLTIHLHAQTFQRAGVKGEKRHIKCTFLLFRLDFGPYFGSWECSSAYVLAP